MHYLNILEKTKLIGILRGITHKEVLSVAKILVESGFKIIEIPLNSPNAFTSIKILVDEYKNNNDIFIGAGTVCSQEDTKILKDIGASLIISPNVDVGVIKKTKELNLISCPGFLSPSEAYTAINAGADCLKLFPFRKFGSEYFKDIKVIIPANIPIIAVGGIDETNIKQFQKSGIKYFGLGSSLYKPNISLNALKEKADFFVNSIKDVNG